MSEEHSKSNVWVTFAAVIGGFAIFLIILVIAYLPKRPEPLTVGQRTPAERSAALAELRAKEHDVTTTYGWVDQQNGIVRIPVSEAMKLTVEKYSK